MTRKAGSKSTGSISSSLCGDRRVLGIVSDKLTATAVLLSSEKQPVEQTAFREEKVVREFMYQISNEGKGEKKDQVKSPNSSTPLWLSLATFHRSTKPSSF